MNVSCLDELLLQGWKIECSTSSLVAIGVSCLASSSPKNTRIDLVVDTDKRGMRLPIEQVFLLSLNSHVRRLQAASLGRRKRENVVIVKTNEMITLSCFCIILFQGSYIDSFKKRQQRHHWVSKGQLFVQLVLRLEPYFFMPWTETDLPL